MIFSLFIEGTTRAKDIKSVLVDNVVEVREGARAGGHKKGTLIFINLLLLYSQ